MRADAGGHDPRHRGLHGAGAGAGQGGRQARRHLGVRVRALRDAHRQRRVRGRDVSDTLAACSSETCRDPTQVPARRGDCCAAAWRRIQNGGCRNRRSALLLEESPSLRTRPSSARFLPWAVAIGCLVAALAVAAIHFRETAPPEERSVRFRIPPPEKSTASTFRLSPDGRHLVIVVVNEVGGSRLYIRRLDLLAAQPIPGS